MLARFLVIAILLGWVLPLPVRVAARDGSWWQKLFRPSGNDESTKTDHDPTSSSAADTATTTTTSLASSGARHTADNIPITLTSSDGVYDTSSNDWDPIRSNESGTGSEEDVLLAVGSSSNSSSNSRAAVSSGTDTADGGSGSNGSSDKGSVNGAGNGSKDDGSDGDGEGDGTDDSTEGGEALHSSSGGDGGGATATSGVSGRGGGGAVGVSRTMISSTRFPDVSDDDDGEVNSSSSSNSSATGVRFPSGGRKGPLYGGYDPYILSDDWSGLDRRCPHANLTRLPRPCFVLHWICVHQETLVTHDPRYSYSNPRRDLLPDMPWVENWNFPAGVGANTDALRGRGPRYRLHMRPASAHEPTTALRNPVFTNCTLPLVIVADFPYNMGEFFAKVVTALDFLTTTALDDKATVVLQTPMGLSLAPFHSLLMMPYSRYPAITVSELGARRWGDPRVSEGSSEDANAAKSDCNDPTTEEGSDGGDGDGESHRAVPWSIESSQPHCFQRMVMCKWDLQTGGGTPHALVAKRVVSFFVEKDILPPSPIMFPGSSTSTSSKSTRSGGNNPDPDPRGYTTLRVLIESRQGPVRNIKNLEELLAACQEMDKKGFAAGTFRHISCAATSFSGPDGSVNQDHFLNNIAAVRSAHVLVVMHGAGATNSWFMRQGTSALVELRPCLFGSRFGGWPDKYMPKQHEKNDDVIRFFALNIEDPAQCQKGDIETALRNHTARRDSVGWDSAFFARDQHLLLKTGPFLAFVRHVGELLLDVHRYRDARDKDQLHAYVVPEGLMYNKLGILDLDEYRAAEKPKVIPFQ